MPDMEQLELNGIVYDVRDPTKAPAGYGYGEYCAYKSWSDADGTAFENYVDATFAENGKVYRLAELATYPDCLVSGNGGYADIHVGFEGEGCLIVGHFYGNGTGLPYLAVKEKIFNKWYPWEYVNPPMELGVEYRTTERWNGKAVYTQLMNFGALPNAKTRQNSAAARGVTQVVGFSGIYINSDGTTSGDLFCAEGVIGQYAVITEKNIEVGVKTDRDMSAYTAQIVLKYTKD